jgi:hypothetical protein
VKGIRDKSKTFEEINVSGFAYDINDLDSDIKRKNRRRHCRTVELECQTCSQNGVWLCPPVVLRVMTDWPVRTSSMASSLIYCSTNYDHRIPGFLSISMIAY